MFAIVVVVVVAIMRVIFSLDVYHLVPLCMLANIALDAGFFFFFRIFTSLYYYYFLYCSGFCHTLT